MKLPTVDYVTKTTLPFFKINTKRRNTFNSCLKIAGLVNVNSYILHNLPFTKFIYKLGNVFIDYTESQVDLGVTVSSKLHWTEQCDKHTESAST